MAWLAVDEDGSEWMYASKPSRGGLNSWIIMKSIFLTDMIQLPKGSILLLTEEHMNWSNEPFELVVKDEDETS